MKKFVMALAVVFLTSAMAVTVKAETTGTEKKDAPAAQPAPTAPAEGQGVKAEAGKEQAKTDETTKKDEEKKDEAKDVKKDAASTEAKAGETK